MICSIRLSVGQDVKNFNDDSRLSRLVRRVCREDDRNGRVSAVKQLRDFLLQPENAKVGAVTFIK